MAALMVSDLSTQPIGTMPRGADPISTTARCAERETWTDAELLLAVRVNDSEAYAELWHRHEALAYRFARTFVSPSDVDDVVAESFLKTLRAIRSGRGPVDEFQKYLMVTV